MPALPCLFHLFSLYLLRTPSPTWVCPVAGIPPCYTPVDSCPYICRSFSRLDVPRERWLVILFRPLAFVWHRRQSRSDIAPSTRAREMALRQHQYSHTHKLTCIRRRNPTTSQAKRPAVEERWAEATVWLLSACPFMIITPRFFCYSLFLSTATDLREKLYLEVAETARFDWQLFYQDDHGS